jgi:AcrR family transcriptional regulator
MTGATASFKERQRQAREEAILDAAGEVFAERGFHAASLDEIAARVGIAKGTIYLHFASKDALLVALVAHSVSRLTALIAAPDPARSVLDQLRTVLDRLVEHRNHGVQAVGDMMQEVKRIIAASAACEEAVRGLRERLAALIDEGKRRGEIDPGVSTTVAVGALFALLSPRAYERMMESGDVAPGDVHDALVRLYLRGIAREGVALPVAPSNDTAAPAVAGAGAALAEENKG